MWNDQPSDNTLRQVHRPSKRVSKLKAPFSVLIRVRRYAYVEFSEPEHIDAALAMDNSLFRGRLIKVSPRNSTPLAFADSYHVQVTAKRTNVPGFGRGRGRGGGGYRGGYRGGFRGGGGYSPYPRARGR